MTETALDPVCGMSVDVGPAASRIEFAGVTYLFCCSGCREKFGRDPRRYLEPRAAVEPAPVGATFVCPMHPEVAQATAGACPSCGMALEPSEPTLDDATLGAERKRLRRRLSISAALTLPLLLVAMTSHRTSSDASGPCWQAVLALPVVIWGGATLWKRGFDSLRHRSPNMYTLIALGVLASTIVSLIELALGRSRSLYFESAAAIVTLTLLGEELELRARSAAGAAIRSLLARESKRALRIEGLGNENDVPIEAVRHGDKLRVRPGELVPVDGTVISGTSTIDRSLLTGESTPVSCAVGERVFGGTLNQDGSFVMRAEQVGQETLLQRLVREVAAAQRTRAPIQQLADRVARWFVPAVIGSACLTAALWLLLAPERGLDAALIAAVTVLVVACPCALGLATPMSIIVAAGRGARDGIFVRDAAALERLGRADLLILDKTGTLTRGEPSVIEFVAASDSERQLALRLAASLANSSAHPLSGAIRRWTRQQGVVPQPIEEFESIPGLGVQGSIDGELAYLGSTALLQRAGIEPIALADSSHRGATLVHLALGRRRLAAIKIADELKPEASATLTALRAEGLEVWLASGDAPAPTEAVAVQLGIERRFSQLLPSDKADLVRGQQRLGRCVAFAGDGINDAAALSVADASLAMGGGSDVALGSAGLVLLHGDVRRLLRARRLARATLSNIRIGLVLAFGYNAVAVPLAAGALNPATGWSFGPALAAAAMSFSSLSVIVNALRLRAVDLR